MLLFAVLARRFQIEAKRFEAVIARCLSILEPLPQRLCRRAAPKNTIAVEDYRCIDGKPQVVRADNFGRIDPNADVSIFSA